MPVTLRLTHDRSVGYWNLGQGDARNPYWYAHTSKASARYPGPSSSPPSPGDPMPIDEPHARRGRGRRGRMSRSQSASCSVSASTFRGELMGAHTSPAPGRPPFHALNTLYANLKQAVSRTGHSLEDWVRLIARVDARGQTSEVRSDDGVVFAQSLRDLMPDTMLATSAELSLL